jgi:hypothetical protein
MANIKRHLNEGRAQCDFSQLKVFLSRLRSHHLSTFVILLTKMTFSFLMLLSMFMWIPFVDGNVVSSCFLQHCWYVKVMFLTLHTCSELKSLNYRAITIEFVNCLPIQFNGDILLKLPLTCHPLDILDNYKVWIENTKVMFGASCKLVTLRICLDWVS